jgi:hypothetical protein
MVASMMQREPYYIVVDATDTDEHPLGGSPTPALIQAGHGEAYRIDDIWYLRDDARGYTPEAHGKPTARATRRSA